jgi:preprotein translocase subunit SecD
MKLRFLALAMLLSLGPPLVAQSAVPPIIEVRLAVTGAREGYVPRQLGDSTFHVSESVLVSDGDIERADTSWHQGHLMVHTHLTPQGAARLAAATANPSGERMAVFFNGQFTAAVKVVSPLTGRTLIIESVGRPEGEQLAAQILARWPAQP